MASFFIHDMPPEVLVTHYDGSTEGPSYQVESETAGANGPLHAVFEISFYTKWNCNANAGAEEELTATAMPSITTTTIATTLS